ncbi:Zinc finger FLYWCH type [Schistosoma japonicum]|nr:Zinc finger FLYWCH type [Schistosoma japonicum]
MLDVDIPWMSVNNTNTTFDKNFHILTRDLERMEGKGPKHDGSSSEESQVVLDNSSNLCLTKKIHNVKEKKQRLCQSSQTEKSKQNVNTELVNKSNDGQCNLIKVRVGFDVTRKGERSLVINGYKFTKSRDGMGDRVFWRCSRRECKATAVTVSNKVEHVRSIHSHLPPVAAEFFSNDSSRSEQEVRFNNLVYTQRSRIRRRSQPNPSTKITEQLLSKPCLNEQTNESRCPTSYSITSSGISYEKYSSAFTANVDNTNDLCFDSSEYVTPMKKRHYSDQVPSDYLTLQTMSALITKWVDSKQLNVDGEMKKKISDISKCSLPLKKLTNIFTTNENCASFNNTLISPVNNHSNSTCGNVNEEFSSSKINDEHVMESDSFKQSNTLDTSLNYVYNHNTDDDLMRMNKPVQSIKQNDEASVEKDGRNGNLTNDNLLGNSVVDEFSNTHQSDVRKFVTSPSSTDVTFLGHDSQRHLILLDNHRLNGLLKMINSIINKEEPKLNNCSQINNLPIQIESLVSPLLQKSNLDQDISLKSSGLLTVSDAHSTRSLAECTTTYCCSDYPRLNSRVVNHNDCCIPLFHHTYCYSTEQIPKSFMNPSSVNDCSSGALNKMSNSVAVINNSGCGYRFNMKNKFMVFHKILIVNDDKSCSPNLLIHWKKEKIRESVGEDRVNSLNGLYDNVTTAHQSNADDVYSNILEIPENNEQISVTNTPLSKCSSEILYNG